MRRALALLVVLGGCGGSDERGRDAGAASDAAPDGGPPCTPGETDGCDGPDAVRVCLDSGEGFTAVPCPDDAPVCLPSSGECGARACEPSSLRCVDATLRERCDASGSAWKAEDPCPLGTTCDAGECVGSCALAAERGTEIGCAFFAVDLDKVATTCTLGCEAGQTCDVDTNLCEPNAASDPFAVSIANPGGARATVTIANGATGDVREQAVDGGAVVVVELDRLDVDGSGRTSSAYRITSDVPVLAHQINPPAPGGHASEGSLLLPDSVLGDDYVVVDWPTGPYGSTSEPLGTDINPGAFAYVTIVAASPGETSVTVTPTSGVAAGPGVAPLSAGAAARFDLAEGEVLNLETEVVDGADLSGTRIESTQPVAVFVGHECAFVRDDPLEATCGHLEEQLPPVGLWGTRVFGARSRARGTVVDLWRVVASTDGTLLRTDPILAGVDGVSLDAAEVLEFAAGESFELDASAPVLVARLTSGPLAEGFENTCAVDLGPCDADCAGGLECAGDPPRCVLSCDRDGDCTTFLDDATCGAEGHCLYGGVGAPTLSFPVPADRFRAEHAIDVPMGLAETWVAVVASSDTETRLDDVVVGDLDAIGASGFSIGWPALPPSASIHWITADAPVAVSPHGYSCDAAYAFTGGFASPR